MAGVIPVYWHHKEPMNSHIHQLLSGMAAHQEVRAYILYRLHMHTLGTISDNV